MTGNAVSALPVSLLGQATPVSANVQATANVLGNLTVTGQQDLLFGDVFPGLAKTVAPADGGAGRFQIGGTGTYEVSLDFTLPGTLSDGVVSTMPISFGGNSAGYGPNISTVSSTFDPSGVTNANLVGGALYVFIGGTVTPAAAQTPGGYSGTVTLTVAYTGS